VLMDTAWASLCRKVFREISSWCTLPLCAFQQVSLPMCWDGGNSRYKAQQIEDMAYSRMYEKVHQRWG
jgi:hypothetical protein